MTRFTNQQIQDAYARPYILPRRVTMVTDFQRNTTIDLLPSWEVRVVPNQNHFVFNHVKWIRVLASSNRQPAGDGWIPKSVLHDFAYAALVNTQATGVSFGGDNIDYDTNTATDRTAVSPNLAAVRSRCLDCGATLTSHKLYEDQDLAGKMATLIGMLSEFEGALKKKHGDQWVVRNGVSGDRNSIMLGMARTGGGRYILAYSGNDNFGKAALVDAVERLAAKSGSKGKWSIADPIPAGTAQLTRRNGGPPLTLAAVRNVFAATGLQNPAGLDQLSCAAPKLLHHAFDVMHMPLAAMTETWYQPSNAKSYDSSVGQVLRRHGQSVPSCRRCSTVVRLLLCP